MNKKDTSYDIIDPHLYESRHTLSSRENYLHEHWKPIVTKAIEAHSVNRDKGVALDLGCGTGAYFMPLLHRVTNLVLGIDISMNLLKYGKKSHEKFNLILSDALQLPLGNQSVDIVTSNAFEYLDRKAAVEEIWRVLKNGGICIVLTLNKYSPYQILSEIAKRVFRKRRDKDLATCKELTSIFQNTGFKLIELRMDDGLIWLPSILDKLVGKEVYTFVAALFRLFGRNPFSNDMFFVVRKG
jgi:ubiquinone/menaquinone biosynthesis C-methylase UbiE